MKKLILTDCKICGKTKNARGFSFHVSQTHKISIEDYILKYEFNNIRPTCKCGCGAPVTIRSYQIMDYVDGHCDAGHFKTGVDPRKNHERWLKNVTEGIRKYNCNAKKLDSSYRKGVKNNFYGKKHTTETINRIKEKTENQIKNGKHKFLGNLNGRLGKSSLEIKFENYVKTLKIKYEHNYKISYLPENKLVIRFKYYDFYIPVINTVIEIHGSYWHPRENKENLSEMQKGNLLNDQFKEKLAKDNGYKLITIYDYELDNFINNDLLSEIVLKRKDTDKLIVES